MSWSVGQEQALEQLEEIAERASGDLTIVTVVGPSDDSTWAKIEISISTKHLEKVQDGLPVRARERLRVYIPHGFPRDLPRVYATHKRFSGFPHVQWATFLCLYQAPGIEWVPSDGMYGFVQRLNEWFRAAAINQLDPDDAPLHPPVVYATSDVQVISRADAPKSAENANYWVGTAHMTKVSGERLDLANWSEIDETPKEIPENVALAPTILLDDPFPIEYPGSVYALIMALKDRGIPVAILFKLLELYALLRKADDALFVVVGAPMRRKEAGGDLKQHIAVWRIEPDVATDLAVSVFGGDIGDAAEKEFIKWAATAKTEWCPVHEDRPEITVKRDEGAVSNWLRGKKILLLGCGALGSFVAEYLVRAGVARLDLVDYGLVKPGLLVRQLFSEKDVGLKKSISLKRRVDEISPSVECCAHSVDLRQGVLTKFPIESIDLVIDATASHIVSHIIEIELASLRAVMPIASMSVSANADCAMATTRMGDYAGGPLDVARQAKLAVFKNVGAKRFRDAFWPKREDIQLFQPEPGCSEPTFLGSAIDMAVHSSAMFNVVLERIQNLDANEASTDFFEKPSSVLDGQSYRHIGLDFASPERLSELRSEYRVLVSPGAVKSIEAYIRKGARELGETVETGGLMFGEVDDSLQTIWLDAASGPPPDSEASESQFLCGVEGTSELAQAMKSSSGSSSRFIGIWHTHPVSMPSPSTDDLNAMANLLHMQEKAPRQTVMLIIGHTTTDPQKAFYIYRRNEFIPVVVKMVAALTEAARYDD